MGTSAGGPAGKSRIRASSRTLQNAIDDVARAERESAVDQHGAQLVLGDVGLERQQRPELARRGFVR